MSFWFQYAICIDRKYIATNNLSKQFRESFDNIDKTNKKNIDKFIDNQLNYICFCSAQISTSNKNKSVLEKNYSEELE